MRLIVALRQRRLVVLWLGQLFSAIGDQMYSMAVIWLAIHTAASDAGAIVAVQYASLLFFSLFGGVFADRLNRAKVMISSDLLRGVAVLSLPLAGLFGPIQIWHLYVVALLVGAFGSLFDPALQASLPQLTDTKETLHALTGLMDTTQRFARLIGPGLVTLLALFIPMMHLYTLDAVSFAFSAFTVAIIAWKLGFARFHPYSPEAVQIAKPASILAEIFKAIGIVWANPILFWSFVSTILSNAIWAYGFVLGVPLLVTQRLGGNLDAYGLIVGAYGASNLVGSFVANTSKLERPAATIFLGQVLYGSGLLILGLATSVPIAVAGALIAAFGPPSSDLNRRVVIQQLVAVKDMGKVFSLLVFVGTIGLVVALSSADALFQMFGLTTTIAITAALVIILNLVSLVIVKKSKHRLALNYNTKLP